MDSPETRTDAKTSVFLSYSRKDADFAIWLRERLEAEGIEVYRDVDDTLPGEEWWRRLQELIAKSDTVVFVLSPNSVASTVCADEVAYAQSRNKRTFPAVLADVDWAAVPEGLAKVHSVFFSEAARREAALQELIAALGTDIAWVREHTRLQERASLWERKQRSSFELLRGKALDEAEQWLAAQPKSAAAPTLLHREYVKASRDAGRRRRNLLTAGLGAGLLAAAALAGVALWQRAIAVQSETRAVAGEEHAKANEAQAKTERDRALLTQSRFLADLAKQAMGRNEPTLAALLALDGLPDSRSGMERPYIAALESTLYQAAGRMREALVLREPILSAYPNPYLASIDPNGTATLYDVETARPIRVLEGGGRIVAVAFSHDNRWVATGSSDGTTRIWDVASGREPATLAGHRGPVATVTFRDKDTLFTASEDGSALLWNVTDQKLLLAMSGHEGKVTDFYLSYDKRRAVTVTEKETIRLWDTEAVRELARLEGARGRAQPGTEAVKAPSDKITAYFSPDNRYVLLGRSAPSPADVTILLDTEAGGELARFDGTSHSLFLGQGRSVLLGGHYQSQNRNRVWDVQARRTIVDVPYETKIEWMSDRFLVWSPTEATATLWDAQTAEPITEIAGPLRYAAAHFTASRLEHFVTVGGNGDIAVWDPQGRLLRRMGDGFQPENSVLVRGRRLIAHSGSGSLKLWNLDSGQKLVDLSIASSWYTWEAGRQRLAARTDDRSIRIWDIETGTELSPITVKDEEKLGLFTFSADGSRIAAATGARTAKVWEVETAREVAALRSPADDMEMVQLSADGRRLLSTRASLARIWDVASQSELGSFLYLGSSLEFSPAGAAVLRREYDSSHRLVRIQIWHADDGATHFLHQPARKITHLASLPGRSNPAIAVITAPMEEPRITPEIRDSRTGGLIRELSGHRGNLYDARFSRNGKRVVTRSADRTARIWDATSGQMIAVVGTGPVASLGGQAMVLTPGERAISLLNIERAASVAPLAGSARNLNFVRFSPDEKFLITLAEGDGARLWDVETGREIARWASVVGVALDNERAIALHTDGSVGLMELVTGRLVAKVDAAPVKARNGFLRHRLLLLTFEDGSARLLDAATGSVRAEFQPDIGESAAADVSDDGRRLFVWSRESGKLALRSAETGAPIAMLRHDPAVAFDRLLVADGRRLLTVDRGVALLSDSETGETVRRLEAHAAPIAMVRISRDRGRILTVAKDGEGRTWDALTGALLARLPGSGVEVASAAFSPDGGRVAMKSGDETFRLWDSESGAEIIAIKPEPHHDVAFWFSADGDRFLLVRNSQYAAGAETVQLLHPDTGNPLRTIEHKRPLQTLVASPDGSRLLTVTNDSRWRPSALATMEGGGPPPPDDATVHLWDANGLRLARLEGNPRNLSLAFSLNSARFVAVSHKNLEWKVQLWESASGRPLAASTGKLSGSAEIRGLRVWFTPDDRLTLLFTRSSTPAAFIALDGENAALVAAVEAFPAVGDDRITVSPKGKWTLVVPQSSQGRLPARLWDNAAGKEIAAFSMPQAMGTVAFSGDERLLATASYDGTVQVRDIASGTVVRELATGGNAGLAFSADASLLLVGSSDGTVKSWSVETGELMKTLRSEDGQNEDIADVFFLSDRRRVAARSNRGLRIWDFPTGQQVALLEAVTDKPEFGIDNRYVVMRSWRAAKVRRIFGATQDLVEAVQSAAPRCLTAAERKVHFLDPEPPRWCIEQGKWPYRTHEWARWLADKTAGKQTAPPAE